MRLVRTAEALKELRKIIEPILKEEKVKVTIHFHGLRVERVLFRIHIGLGRQAKKLGRRTDLMKALEMLDELIAAIIRKQDSGWYLPVGKEYTTQWIKRPGGREWALQQRETDIESDTPMTESGRTGAQHIGAGGFSTSVPLGRPPGIGLLVGYSSQRIAYGEQPSSMAAADTTAGSLPSRP